MKASILDLRYKMNDVLKALDRNEKVEVLYHGKLKGILSACSTQSSEGGLNQKVEDHPFFASDLNGDVDSQIDDLRKSRYDF